MPKLINIKNLAPIPAINEKYPQQQPIRFEPICSVIFIFTLWVFLILAIDPRGEFAINDDWCFVKSLHALIYEGKVIPTGWGNGGPSLIVHLLWGGIFSFVFGPSMTTLRISILAIAILGSISLLLLLRSMKAPRWLSLLGTLTLILNPLFLSQSFSFMTDVTFTALAAMSLFLLHVGMEDRRISIIFAGLVLATGSILTRQIGIVIPLAFIASIWLTPQGRRSEPLKLTIATLLISFIPWLAWEVFLDSTGSTPVIRHYLIHNITDHFINKGWRDYLVFVFSQLFQVAFSYSAFLVSPLIILLSGKWLKIKAVKIILGGYLAIFLLFETAILTGTISPPVTFYRNIITDFGIGPLLYKDTYILHYQRLTGLPSSIYYLLVFVTLPMIVSLLGLIIQSIQRLVNGTQVCFIGFLALLASIGYLGIITLTGFHDRYLIPVCLFFMVWLVSEWNVCDSLHSRTPLVIAFVLLTAIGTFAVTGTHDFMATKRAGSQATDFLLHELNVNPCHVDGGFEFNGFHCYRKDFLPKPDLSWWWVDREDYLITLGPLPGYTLLKSYPIDRWLGSDGAVLLLKPDSRIF